MFDCTKMYYPDQATARLALEAIQTKAPMKDRTKVPVRIYPCDVCDGWHLTAKRSIGKQPPWDLNPNWVRPGSTAHLEVRHQQTRQRRPRRRRTSGPTPRGGQD